MDKDNWIVVWKTTFTDLFFFFFAFARKRQLRINISFVYNAMRQQEKIVMSQLLSCF